MVSKTISTEGVGVGVPLVTTAVHVAAVSVPKEEHELVPETVYPDSHVGWHIKPLARELVQSPAPPFVGAADASHGSAEHVAAVRVPAVHELVPETMYPELHVGWHVDPLARELVQSPATPLAMAPDASHGSNGAIIVLNTKEDDVNEVTVSPVIVE